MFGSNNGGSSLFGGGINTSTPTSKVTSSDNAFQPRQKSASGGIFGDLSSGRLNGVSTPSPSVGIFGGSNSNAGTQSGANGLFGAANKPAPNFTGGLFGNNLSTPVSNSNPQQSSNASSGGLFGSANQGSSGLNGSSLFNKPQVANNASGSLFSNANNKNQNGGNPGGLFGNSSLNSTFTPQASGTNGGSQNAGGFLGNKVQIGGQNTNGTSSGNFMASSLNIGGNNASVPSSDNPYGLQFSKFTSNVDCMPEPITKSVKGNGSSSSGISAEKLRKSSVSSNLPQTKLQGNATLIGKLSSRLKTARGTEPTQGLFSPLRKPMFRQENRLPSPTVETAAADGLHLINTADSTSTNNRKEISDMRKLKVDTGRSAAKKIKLFNGVGAATSLKVLGRRNSENTIEDAEEIAQVPLVSTDKPDKPLTNDSANAQSTGYWCSPSIEQLMRLPLKQLCSVPNFVIGRRGFGSISFDGDVDLSSFVGDLKGSLFGKVVIFHGNRTVEVYPNNTSKPTFGYGLNVPATITLEQVYAVDKKTNNPIKDHCSDEVQAFIKRLRRLKGMSFVSYNPFEGLWTFKVKHFSIWGLVDEKDDDGQEAKGKGGVPSERKIALPKRKSATDKAIDPIGHADDEDIAIPGDESRVENQDFGAPSTTALLAEDADMIDVLDEKPYEPSDVSSEDLEGIEVKTSSNTPGNWTTQLQIAGESYNSVFRFSNGSLSNPRKTTSYFQKGDNILTENKAKSHTGVPAHSHGAAKSSTDSKLFRQSGQGISNVHLQETRSCSKDAAVGIVQAFKDSLANVEIGLRDLEGYPRVEKFPVNLAKIGTFLAINDEQRVWELLSILFDDDNTHSIEQPRYQRLCAWLIREISEDVLKRADVAQTASEKIYYYLIVGDVVGATKLAINTKNAHLAVILTLLGAKNSNVQSLAAEQLRKWKALNRKVDSFVTRIFQLLSGQFFAQSASVDLTTELSWLECLSIELLYGDVKNHSLEDVILQFSKRSAFGDKPITDEVTFKILKFFGCKGRDDNIFQSVAFSEGFFDYRNSWFLLQALRFKNYIKFTEEQIDRITLEFFEYLVANKLYSEGLSALLFIHDDALAKKHIDSLIEKHVKFFSKDSSKQLLETFKIPRSLIFRAMALYHKNEGDHLAEAENYLDGGLIKDGILTILKEVGPELIIKSFTNNDSLLALRELIKKIPESNPHSFVKDLGFFKDYLKFTLDNDSKPSTLERLLQHLPVFYSAYGKTQKVSVCCSVIANVVSLTYLREKDDEVTKLVTRDQLLALPLGEPEMRYVKKRLNELSTNR